VAEEQRRAELDDLRLEVGKLSGRSEELERRLQLQQAATTRPPSHEQQQQPPALVAHSLLASTGQDAGGAAALAGRLQAATAAHARLERRAAEVEDWLAAARAALREVRASRPPAAQVAEPPPALPPRSGPLLAEARRASLRVQLEAAGREREEKQRELEEASRGASAGEQCVLELHQTCGELTGVRKALLTEQTQQLGELEAALAARAACADRAAALQERLVGAARHHASELAQQREQVLCEEAKLLPSTLPPDSTLPTLEARLAALRDTHVGLLVRRKAQSEGDEAAAWAGHREALQASCDAATASLATLREELGVAVAALRQQRAGYTQRISEQRADLAQRAAQQRASEEAGQLLADSIRDEEARADALEAALAEERARAAQLQEELLADHEHQLEILAALRAMRTSGQWRSRSPSGGGGTIGQRRPTTSSGGVQASSPAGPRATECRMPWGQVPWQV